LRERDVRDERHESDGAEPTDPHGHFGAGESGFLAGWGFDSDFGALFCVSAFGVLFCELGIVRVSRLFPSP
jgi:hypothetical protein